MNFEAIRNAHILVVDDERTNLLLLDKMLRQQGYENLTLVSDPREVLSAYHARRPALVLLDINMPHMDGYQVMAQLKALNDPLLPPIVILTAQEGRDFVLRALDAGARDFVAKPFDRNELMMRVRNLLDAELAHRMLHDQKDVLEEMVRQRTEQLHHTRLQIVQRLGRAAEYRDEETGNHILRMSHTCALLARAAGWSECECDLMLNASPMHDIGKIGIPDAILLKPGRLTPPEWEIMKTHAAIGARLLDGDNSDLMLMARDIAHYHHEKWDGSGYPFGLAGAAIPMAGRIAALADVFDALTSCRPYKPAWTVEAALDYVKSQSGSHFDPALVEAFLGLESQVQEVRERFAESLLDRSPAIPGHDPG
ncbi:MAG: two-component system response regulator [Moraxellaceae bacterium]|jgi:putative two-component system response regulator|nr:two-component system response regulator [Moraxellaceae bacterium]